MAEVMNSSIETVRRLQEAIGKVIRGRSDTIDLVITALLADGQTLLTKTLGRLISTDDQTAVNNDILPFRRIQFTPDMLPGDVLGVNVFEPESGSFRFVHGPVFAHVVLADELNRTGPKVQAAFLECMAEKQVTIDNKTYPLDELFFVVGTQNPLDLAGTYPLPLVQLDRFLLKIPMSYVDAETEIEILQNHTSILETAGSIDPVCTREEVLAARKGVTEVHLNPVLQTTIVKIVQATRNNALLQFGVSTRAAIMLQRALQAYALVQGRDHATEDDLKHIAPFVLLHRMRFHGGVMSPQEGLEEIMAEPMEELISSGFARSA
jgi:MoxR-like ATPase